MNTINISNLSNGKFKCIQLNRINVDSTDVDLTVFLKEIVQKKVEANGLFKRNRAKKGECFINLGPVIQGVGNLTTSFSREFVKSNSTVTKSVAAIFLLKKM